MLDRGSQWRRWEPHIHTPGTVLNNQFGPESWDEYLSKLENLSPRIKVIAPTDYYVTDTYEEFLRFKASGRLPNVKLIFPNIELRLDVAAKSGFVNVHLLVSPEDPNHIVEVQRFLSRLHFPAFGDQFDCTRGDLIRLGRRFDPSLEIDSAALECGATQYKINFYKLREAYQASDWAKQNILIAVAGTADDGTSGLRQAADKTLREEIETFANIVFASSPAQREFWLGQRSVSVETLRERYNGCKPCLHGSDSHNQTTVGQPANDRYTWIKGGLEFDALRQACIDPERAFVGTEPPRTAMPSQVISQISIGNADWIQTPEIPLNPGLVAIIGARGSGKTALADMIAAGCDSIPQESWRASENTTPSFLARARSVITDEAVTLTWGGGDIETRSLDGRDANGHLSFQRARYLSQQFVEELCSSSGVSDGLVEEIERVIFEAHSPDEREGAINFAELREYRTSRYRQAREREVEAISNISKRIAAENEKEKSKVGLDAQIKQKKRVIANYNADLAKLVVKGTEEQVKRHAILSESAQLLRNKIQAFIGQRRTFLTMQDEVESTRATKVPELLRQARERHKQSGLSDEQWDLFLLVYKGDVDTSLIQWVEWADKNIAELTGDPIEVTDPNTPLISDDAELGVLKLSTIEAEVKRLEALFSADKIVRDQYAALTKRIAKENAELKDLEAKLTDAQGATERRKSLQIERDNAYGRAFEAIINEQKVLEDLYAPLVKRLEASSGTLRKLGFFVRRVVNVKQWGVYAEENLLDLRKNGRFMGRGSLVSLAAEKLKPAWENGTSEEIQEAMTNFMNENIKEFFKHAPYDPANHSKYGAWLREFAMWLFGTEHISVRYEVIYDGVDIRKLSPGTRGIVLLLLYLALDENDDRPLIIDQPEENLDPKSVFDELVPLFIKAKAKRQVIMVTHNANLVINTDADQIIVAEAGPLHSGTLPPITYKAGGLDNASIRKTVCDILEGGDRAFQERARRLRVRFARL